MNLLRGDAVQPLIRCTVSPAPGAVPIGELLLIRDGFWVAHEDDQGIVLETLVTYRGSMARVMWSNGKIGWSRMAALRKSFV